MAVWLLLLTGTLTKAVKLVTLVDFPSFLVFLGAVTRLLCILNSSMASLFLVLVYTESIICKNKRLYDNPTKEPVTLFLKSCLKNTISYIPHSSAYKYMFYAIIIGNRVLLIYSCSFACLPEVCGMQIFMLGNHQLLFARMESGSY